MSARSEPMFAETDQERELLRVFRAMTPVQRKAAMKMIKAMVAFSKTMLEGADHAR